MNRKCLFEFYPSTRGQLLQQREAAFLQRSITVGCKQSILQIGGLGWENKYIDYSLYQRFMVLDRCAIGSYGTQKIVAEPRGLPVQSNSVDMVILPHLLEFESDQHQTLREIERVLKPEGKLIILNFNPWNMWVRYRYTFAEGKKDPLLGGFISRARILDWLKLLNFEVDVIAGFNFKSSYQLKGIDKNSLSVVSYAVKAVKRRYTLIPLTTVRVKRPRLAVVGGVEPSTRLKKHG